MKFLSISLIVSVTLVLGACTPAKLVRLQTVQEDNRSEILIYREEEFNAGLALMVFGANGEDYIKFSTDQFAKMYLSSGPNQLFVRSTQGDKAATLDVDLKVNETSCYRAFGNPTNYGKAFLPFGQFVTSTFLIEESECPSDEVLSEYKEIKVNYQ